MTCCCGHDENMHTGGPDLSVAELKALHFEHPGGDGGMCRAIVDGQRCHCFNFCDCGVIRSEIEAEIEDIEAGAV